MRGLPELQRLVREAAEEAGGYRRLAERSGGLVRASTLNSVATGRHQGRFQESSVRGIASCVGKSPREVARLLGVQLGEERHRFVLPRRADALTVPQRRVVLAVIDAIITAGVTGQASTDGSDRRVARRRG